MSDLKVKKFTVGMLKTNCYLLIKGKNCLIIDPGDDADYLYSEVQREDVNPLFILATHGHFDHVMATLELKINFKIPFLINKKDSFLLERQKQTAKHFQSVEAIPSPKIDKDLDDMKVVDPDGFNLEIIKTPGHTPGSVSFYDKDSEKIFSGDLIFKKGIGRYDFSYANKGVLKDSLERIKKLPANTIVYPGHGEITTLENETKNLKNMISLL